MKPPRPKTPKKPTKQLKVARDPIEVYCRIRPLFDEEEDVCVRIKDERSVVLVPPEVSQSSNGRTPKVLHYSFKYVFDETTSQKDLFDHVCLPLVKAALQGNNGLLFTYGISSSGKTYTMEGTPQDGGLLPRSLDVIFNSIKDVQAKKYIFKPDRMNGFEVQSIADAFADQQKELGLYNRYKSKIRKEVVGDRIPDSTTIKEISFGMCYCIFVSYVEIYNNYIYDLLDENIKTSKILREDAANNVYVFGAQENEVKSVEEALDLFYKGQEKRKRAHTALNTESSRSHSVFTIRIVQAPFDNHGEVLQNKENLVISQLSLVDLAGSERSVRTKNTGYKLKEAGNINSSLMTLRNCIENLRKSQTLGISKMVPYRESKLTYLFKTFFEGEGKLGMIVCINPHVENYEETIHVMQFAEITQEVEIMRPTPVSTPIIPSLRVGYRALYQEAGVPVSDQPVVYCLGPEFPQLVTESPDDESVLINLLEFLHTRIAKRNSLNQDLEHQQVKFRENLIAVSNENHQLKQEKERLEMDLEAREQQIRSLEQKLCSVEESVVDKQRHINEYKRKAENALEEVYEKERMLAEQQREIEKMHRKIEEEKAATKRRMEKIMNEKLAKERRKVCSAVGGIRQLREIINADELDECLTDDNLPRGGIPSTSDSESSRSVTQPKRLYSNTEEFVPKVRFAKTKSATDVHSSNSPGTQISSQSSKNATDAHISKENKPPGATPTSRGIVIANPRHRRSISTGDLWIEHKPIGNLELTTVLQPAMKKKKSVSKLEVKDVTKSEKYLLQHQEQDSEGEVETQLFKGNIIPSVGGGAQVVFNDVEKLRQVSPPPVYNLRKRSGDNLPLREIEDRCTVSVECHGLPSKIMKK